MIMSMETLMDAIRHFSDPQVCIDTVAAMRWYEGKPMCPKCGGMEVLWLKNQLRWKCKAKGCAKQFSVKVGTIFEDSPIALDKWLVAMWMLGNCKNGASSYEVARAVGVTQKSAWFMLQRIRLAMQDGNDDPLGGIIEMDETFVGGKAKNMHASKRAKALNQPNSFKGKAIVVGMLERNGRVRAEVVEARTKVVLHEIAAANIASGSTLMTDEHHPYKGVANLQHEIINHAEAYVRGNVHTNGIESFWSLLKRSLGGTYISVEPFHLFRYIDEQTFRFNNRKVTDSERLALVLSQVAGKRLTYSEVTGKVGQTAA